MITQTDKSNTTSAHNQHTLQICNYRRNYHWTLSIPEKFYAPADKLKSFEFKIDWTFVHKAPVVLDNTIMVTCSTEEQQKKTRIGNEETTGQMIHRKEKSNFYQKKTVWLGHTLAHDATRS